MIYSQISYLFSKNKIPVKIQTMEQIIDLEPQIIILLGNEPSLDTNEEPGESQGERKEVGIVKAQKHVKNQTMEQINIFPVNESLDTKEKTGEIKGEGEEVVIVKAKKHYTKMTCPHCFKYQAKNANVKRHLVLKHKLSAEEVQKLMPEPGTKTRSSTCKKCRKVFSSCTNLKLHKKTHKQSLKSQGTLPKIMHNQLPTIQYIDYANNLTPLQYLHYYNDSPIIIKNYKPLANKFNLDDFIKENYQVSSFPFHLLL